MEPYKPEFRAALKAAHPGLTDAIIDRLEALTARRAMTAPDRTKAHELRAMDDEVEEILRRHMPRFHEVVRAQAAVARSGEKKAVKVDIRMKHRDRT